jgi:hypothetical protein
MQSQAITKEAWNTAQDIEYKREKIQALSLAKECYSMKLDLLTNATVVDDAIRFVAEKAKSKEESNISTNDSEHDNEESNEPDYNEDQDRLEEEQEEETGKVAITTNAVF